MLPQPQQRAYLDVFADMKRKINRGKREQEYICLTQNQRNYIVLPMFYFIYYIFYRAEKIFYHNIKLYLLFNISIILIVSHKKNMFL